MTQRKSIRDDGSRTPPGDTDAWLDGRKTAWDQKVGYTLDNERSFLDGLGGWWNPPARTRRPSRKYLLEKYLTTLDSRRGFSDTDKAVLKAHVLLAIQKEEEGEKVAAAIRKHGGGND